MFIQWYWYVYIIECQDGSYYTGCTWNINERYEQHLSGKGCKYTAKHGVKRMAYYEIHDSLETARIREYRIKRWNRKKKEKLIKGEWYRDW